jgi:DNA-binding CsgD family transcriptional regulator
MQGRSKRRICGSERAVGWSHEGTHHHLKSRSLAAVQVLDQLGVGVIVTDHCGRIVEMNRAAESIARLNDGLLIRDGQLCARRAFETGKVAALITDATVNRKSDVAVGRMLVRRDDILPAYVLTVAPLRGYKVVYNCRFAIIIIVDPQRYIPLEKDLIGFFGLTPAEARLAGALVTGKTLSHIAANFGIQITTARTQLASILRKVGAGRQSDLVRILSTSAFGTGSFSTE